MTSTLRLQADQLSSIAQAADLLRAGRLVAFPTETVYGLGAHAFDVAAVEAIFVAKGRPHWDPLIVHIADPAQLGELTQIDPALSSRVEVLTARFWPGPLTLLLPRSDAVPDRVTAGRSLVGLRVPSHPTALALLRASRLPVAAPSANRFGHTSPTTAGHVLDDLDGRIDAVLDAGPTAVGVESTVLDPGPTPMVIYRAGAITLTMIQEATAVEVQHFSMPVGEQKQLSAIQAEPRGLPSPGVGLRHYAPDTPLVLSGADPLSLREHLRAARERYLQVGVLLPRDWTLPDSTGLSIEPWGRWSEPETLAAELFAALRLLELRGVEAMVAPLPEPGGIRDAVRDRLLKAARTQ